MYIKNIKFLISISKRKINVKYTSVIMSV